MIPILKGAWSRGGALKLTRFQRIGEGFFFVGVHMVVTKTYSCRSADKVTAYCSQAQKWR